MKSILSLIILVFTANVFLQAQTQKELEARLNYVGEKTNVKQFKQPASAKSMRGGGGIVSTDCYSFVPIPNDATELDPFAFANTSIGGLDGWWGPFDIDFDFCHFGVNYNQIYISAKGLISFDAGTTIFVPTEFPSNTINMVAGFWSDVDLRCDDCGEVYWWSTPTAVYVTYVDAGAFNLQGDIGNTFQIVLTDQTDPIIGEGNNVGLFYEDMQWAVGDSAGGVGGFGGTAPGNVGASRTDGNFIQLGRFSQNNDDYDGSFGNADGVHWLDNKGFVFSICSSNDNLPPVSFANDNCDTIFLCQNDTQEINLDFLAPEVGQTVTIEVDTTNASGWVLVEEGDGFISGFFQGTTENTGTHTLIFTATDNGVPAASTTIVYDFVVQDILVPDFVVTGEALNEDDVAAYCAGQDGVLLTASPGFDSYLWSDDSTTPSVNLDAGTQGVIAFFSGCQVEYGPISIFEIPVFNPDVSVESPFLCEGETTQINIDNPEDYTEFSWSVFLGGGTIISTDLENDTITVSPGVYEVSVIDENNCSGSTIIPITLEIINLPTPEVAFPATQCLDSTVTWSGAWADPNDCSLTIFMGDSDGDTWEAANVSVFIDGVGPFNFNIDSAFPFVADGVEVYHGQVVEYFWTAGADDDDISVEIFDSNNVSVFNTADGDLLIDNGLPFLIQTADCGFNELPGLWTDEPAIGTFTDVNAYNPVNGVQSYTVPSDYVGSVQLTFTSSVCNFIDTVDITYGVAPTVTTIDYESCDGTPVTVTPTYGPENLDLDGCFFDWTPNYNSDGNQTAQVNNTGTYTIEISNGCGSDEATGEITFFPLPSASLSDNNLCDGAVATLNPVGVDHPSFVYDWSTESTEPQISVTDAGTYSVTVSNQCGEETAQSTITTAVSPSVSTWANDTILCAGAEIVVDPSWSNVPNPEGPVSWSLTYLDEDGVPSFVSYENNGLDFTIASDMVPAAATSDIVLNYSYSNICGVSNGQVIIIPDLCFIEPVVPVFISAYNVISPDSDGAESAAPGQGGLNEGWQIIGIEEFSNVDVKIFDRWGRLVYENSNYNNLVPWRGEDMNDNELADGVYFYTVYVPVADKELNGTVTVLRKQ